jgi:hypothetical protein
VAGVGITFISLRTTFTIPLAAAWDEAGAEVELADDESFDDDPQPVAATGMVTATAISAMVFGRRFDICTPESLVRLAWVTKPRM